MSEPERVKVNGERYYQVGANKYPSVTTVTNSYEPKKRKLKSWKEGVDNPDEIRDRAAMLGSIVHHRILSPYALRKLPPPNVDLSIVDDRFKSDIEVCEILWEQCNFDLGENPYIEKRTYNHKHGYAGTMDILTEDGVVGDLKTSKAAFPSHKMQVAAYAKAAEERAKLPDPTEAAIIVLHPNPDNNPRMTPKVHRLDQDDIDHWFGEFTGLLSNFT